MKIINLKKDAKLKNKERNMNITHELAGLQEQYNAAFQKFTEAIDEKTKREFEEKLKEIKPKLDILTKIAAEREEDDFKKSEIDKIAFINKRNKEKQNLIDIQNSLLNRKKQREKVVNQYRRKDCAPVNLFDSGYLKKEEKDPKKNEENNAEINIIGNSSNNLLEKKLSEKFDEQKSYFFKKAELLKNLNEFILNKDNEINEIFEKKKKIDKENCSNNNNNYTYSSRNSNNIEKICDENSFIFANQNITEDVLLQLINANNNKISANSKKLNLNDIEI